MRTFTYNNELQLFAAEDGTLFIVKDGKRLYADREGNLVDQENKVILSSDEMDDLEEAILTDSNDKEEETPRRPSFFMTPVQQNYLSMLLLAIIFLGLGGLIHTAIDPAVTLNEIPEYVELQKQHDTLAENKDELIKQVDQLKAETASNGNPIAGTPYKSQAELPKGAAITELMAIQLGKTKIAVVTPGGKSVSTNQIRIEISRDGKTALLYLGSNQVQTLKLGSKKGQYRWYNLGVTKFTQRPTVAPLVTPIRARK